MVLFFQSCLSINIYGKFTTNLAIPEGNVDVKFAKKQLVIFPEETNRWGIKKESSLLYGKRTGLYVVILCCYPSLPRPTKDSICQRWGAVSQVPLPICTSSLPE